MTRALALAAFALALTATAGALAVCFGLTSIPVVPGALLVAYVCIVDPPVLAAVTAALVGLVMDAMAGAPLGVSVIANIAALLAGRLALAWVTSPRSLPAYLFAAGFTGMYSLVALLLLFLFAKRETFGFVDLLAAAVANGVCAIVVFPMTQRLLVVLRLEERDESLQERLASKGHSLL